MARTDKDMRLAAAPAAVEQSTAAPASRPYMFDNASAQEYQRLDLMSKILDPWTRGYLTALGVAPGWNCLELGGGNGSITTWLAEQVGLSGRVVAVDISTALLKLLPDPNVTVQEMDVRSGTLPGRDYD